MHIPGVLSGAALASMIAATVSAHGDATGIVRDRMEAMEEMDRDTRRLEEMFRGWVAYDADRVRVLAEEIRTRAGAAVIQLFPQGSQGAPSAASPEIWSHWPEFRELATLLRNYAEGLALASENRPSRVGTGGDGLMGDGLAMANNGVIGGSPGLEELSEMPPDRVFQMLSSTCMACHTRFRLDR